MRNRTSNAVLQKLRQKNNTSLPIGYGTWAKKPLDNNWVEVTGDYVDATLYPEIWELITGILNGEITNPDITVMTIEQANELLADSVKWKVIRAKQSIAYSYIIDTDNNCFKFPRCINKDLSLGNEDVPVVNEQTEYGGSYALSATGRYVEYGSFLRLERATKIVDNKTYKYYKPTQWCDFDDDIPTMCITDENNKELYVSDIVEIHYNRPFVNDKYSIRLFASKLKKSSEEGLCEFEIKGEYPETYTSVKDNVSFGASLKLYDEEIADKGQDLDIIPRNSDEIYITYCATGYAEPPEISEYNTGYRLYIKVTNA